MSGCVVFCFGLVFPPPPLRGRNCATSACCHFHSFHGDLSMDQRVFLEHILERGSVRILAQVIPEVLFRVDKVCYLPLEVYWIRNACDMSELPSWHSCCRCTAIVRTRKRWPKAYPHLLLRPFERTQSCSTPSRLSTPPMRLFCLSLLSFRPTVTCLSCPHTHTHTHTHTYMCAYMYSPAWLERCNRFPPAMRSAKDCCCNCATWWVTH